MSTLNKERIEAHAELLALSLQIATGMSNGAKEDIKERLIEFAEEIKRQAMEP